MLINPSFKIEKEIKAKLRRYRKVASVWALELTESVEVETLEGKELAGVGDYLCRGIANELWPQSKTKLLANYDPSGVFDKDAWQRFDPKANTESVLAAQLDFPFQVASPRGELNGKPGDFVVVNSSDMADVWIVDQQIFAATYETFFAN